jgi:4-hydroxybenzoate polyprenyltransferase
MSTQSINPSLPAKTRLGRLSVYVAEMFPLSIRVPLNLLNFGFIYVGLQALQGAQPIRFSWISVIGALTVQLLWFFIRVFDELKDAESDIALARAGDPRFVNRPIVTGKVTLEDISALRWWMVAVVFAINVPFGFPALAVGIAIAMGYLTLTYKWLFYPPIRNHVLLVFVTHAPNALVIEIYAAAVFVAEFGMPDSIAAATLLVALWATVSAYEFAYKIRAPQQETALATYSKRLGYPTATVVCMAFLGISIACTLATAYSAGLPWWSTSAIGLIGAWAMWGCLAFLRSPTSERAILTRYVGIYWYASCALLIAAACVQRHVMPAF